MNDNKRRAIVWNMIERLAFRPSSDKDCGTWLSLYARTLTKLWGIEPTSNYLRSNDNFDIPFLNLKCKYKIKHAEKYSASLQHFANSCSYWQNDIDPEYLSKASLYFTSDKYPRLQRAHLQGDIKAILDGMLFHPRCHAHLEAFGVQHVQLDQKRGGLPSHEVRIGGGIENPYVFLLHLRYQFCLVADEARQTERERLIKIFEDAIQRNSANVSPTKLFGFQGANN
jgi:hypothetical protein